MLIERKDWGSILHASAYSFSGLCAEFRIDQSSLRRWLGDKPMRPKNIERMNEVMNVIKETKPIPHHKSFGYATEEQVKRLNELGLCPERDLLMAQIDKQNKAAGKRK